MVGTMTVNPNLRDLCQVRSGLNKTMSGFQDFAEMRMPIVTDWFLETSEWLHWCAKSHRPCRGQGGVRGSKRPTVVDEVDDELFSFFPWTER